MDNLQRSKKEKEVQQIGQHSIKSVDLGGKEHGAYWQIMWQWLDSQTIRIQTGQSYAVNLTKDTKAFHQCYASKGHCVSGNKQYITHLIFIPIYLLGKSSTYYIQCKFINKYGGVLVHKQLIYTVVVNECSKQLIRCDVYCTQPYVDPWAGQSKRHVV